MSTATWRWRNPGATLLHMRTMEGEQGHTRSHGCDLCVGWTTERVCTPRPSGAGSISPSAQADGLNLLGYLFFLHEKEKVTYQTPEEIRIVEGEGRGQGRANPLHGWREVESPQKKDF